MQLILQLLMEGLQKNNIIIIEHNSNSKITGIVILGFKTQFLSYGNKTYAIIK
jgi:hypothetical protein